MTNFRKEKQLPEKAYLDTAIELTSKSLKETLEKAPAAISDITKHLALAQGKAIRTVLLLTCAMDDEGYVPRDAIKAAIAVELFHTATLVHDDIIDDAQLRRGVESVQNKFGKKQAVIAGDYLLCLSFSTISDMYDKYTKLTNDFTRIVARVCMGELSQYKNNSNINLHTWDYLKIISGKTAALFNLSAYAGAAIASLPEKDCRRIAKYGQYLGMIFQIVDDCKDYESNEDKTLKSTQSDLAQGVITLPLILAMKKEPNLKGIVNNVLDNDKGIANFDIIRQVCNLGGTKDSRAIAEKYYGKAQIILEDIDNPTKKQYLSNLLDNALNAANKF